MLPILVMLGVLLAMNTSWTMTLLLIVMAVALFAGNLIMRQETIVYVPQVMPGMQKPSDNPEGMRSPADKGLKFEDVHMRTSDGINIHAWFMPASEDCSKAPTILFCHANAGNIGLRIPNFAKMVETLQVNIFALDYRGFGNSEGTPSEPGLIEDALSSWEWLQGAAKSGRIDGERIFVFGRSLGGAVSIALAHTLQQRGSPLPKGLLLENTFMSISALVDTLFPFIAYKALKDRFLRIHWESIERVKDLTVPLLFLTGEKDELIPPSHSGALKRQAEKSKLRRQVLYPEGMHNDTWEKGGEQYWKDMAQFIADVLAGKAQDDAAEVNAKD